MTKMDLRVGLDELLRYLFEVEDLRLFLRKFVEPRVSFELPSVSASPAQLFYAAAEVLERAGYLLVNDPMSSKFFSDLIGVRPERAVEIRQFAFHAGIELPTELPRLYLRHVDGRAAGVKRVFISYSREDTDWALATALALAHVDIQAVVDVSAVQSGEDFEERIARELDRVDRVILGWSRSARESQWVRKEYLQALQVRREELVERFLIVECLDDTPLPPEMATINARRSFFRTATAFEPLLSALPKDDRMAILRLLTSLSDKHES